MSASYAIVVVLALLAQVEWTPVPLGPAYLTETPVQANRLGLATVARRYSIVLGDGCTHIAPYQNVTVLAAAQHGAVLQKLPEDDDGEQPCSVLVEQRMDRTPCFINADGVCDVAAELE